MMEKITGKKFGGSQNPLLLSVRSGARKSMPGMMETVLNVGLNDTTIQGIIEQRLTENGYKIKNEQGSTLSFPKKDWKKFEMLCLIFIKVLNQLS